MVASDFNSIFWAFALTSGTGLAHPDRLVRRPPRQAWSLLDGARQKDARKALAPVVLQSAYVDLDRVSAEVLRQDLAQILFVDGRGGEEARPDVTIHYAVKALPEAAVLASLYEGGWMLDAAQPQPLYTALATHWLARCD